MGPTKVSFYATKGGGGGGGAVELLVVGPNQLLFNYITLDLKILIF